MNNSKKTLVILSFLVIIICAFGYGYYNTLSKMIKDSPNPKPQSNAKVEYKKEIPIPQEEVFQIPTKDKVSPSTVLYERIFSLNTGNDMLKQIEVPDEIIDLTEEEIKEYYKNYDSVEFTREKIVLEKRLPNLPDHFIVKLENKYIKVFITDAKGDATIYEDFKPILHKNKDEKLEKGIEVERLEDIWIIIQDYE